MFHPRIFYGPEVELRL